MVFLLFPLSLSGCVVGGGGAGGLGALLLELDMADVFFFLCLPSDLHLLQHGIEST